MRTRIIVTSVLGMLIVAALALAEAPKASSDTGKAIVDKVYGDVVWHDSDAGIVVGVAMDGGRVVKVQIDAHKSGVNVTISYPKAGGPPVVEYTSGTLGQPPHLARWRDLNGDGVFDERTLIGDWPLLSKEPDRSAWVSTKWVPMRIVDHNGSKTPEIDGVPHRFDVRSGKWLPESAKPATQPSR